jgi:hypothetical protein
MAAQSLRFSIDPLTSPDSSLVELVEAIIDATFPGDPWDGRSSLPLAAGPGRDYPAGADPDAEKRALEAEHCDPVAREPFIAALAGLSDNEPIHIVTGTPIPPRSVSTIIRTKR